MAPAKESGIEGLSWSTWRGSFSSNFDAHGFLLGTLCEFFSFRLRAEVQGKGIILRTDAFVWTKIEVIIVGIIHLEIFKGSKSDISPSSNVLAL